MVKRSSVLKTARLLVLILIAHPFYGQNFDTLRIENHRNRKLFLRAAAGFVPPMEITNTGKAYLNSKQLVTPVVDIGYYEPLYKNLGMSLGVGMAPIPFGFKYEVPIDPENPEHGYYDLEASDYSAINVYLFVQAAYTFFLAKDLYCTFEVGTQLNYLPGYGIGIGHSIAGPTPDDDLELFDLYMDYEMRSGWFFSFKSNAGLEYALHTHHVLMAGVNLHYYPHEVATGTYQFDEDVYNSWGTTALKMNYLGLVFGYGFRF